MIEANGFGSSPTSLIHDSASRYCELQGGAMPRLVLYCTHEIQMPTLHASLRQLNQQPLPPPATHATHRHPAPALPAAPSPPHPQTPPSPRHSPTRHTPRL